MAGDNIKNSCAQILKSVRNCNLNYACQETPFSIYLTIRKSWNKQHQTHASGPPVSEPLHDIAKVVSENLSLKYELSEVQSQLETAKDITSEIETKVEAAEAEVYKVHKNTMKWKEALAVKDDEIKLLKTTIKNNNSENLRNNTEIKSLKKILKSREQEAHNLENCNLNLKETITNLKANASEFKKEKKILESNAKSLEKKVLNLQKESNNNNRLMISPLITKSPVFTSQATSSRISLGSLTPSISSVLSTDSKPPPTSLLATPPSTPATPSEITSPPSRPLSPTTSSKVSADSSNRPAQTASCSPRTPPGSPPTCKDSRISTPTCLATDTLPKPLKVVEQTEIDLKEAQSEVDDQIMLKR